MSRLALLLLLCSSACRAGEGQAVVASGDAARGFELVRARGCTSCHASAAVAAEPAPRLEQVGARLTPAALEAALGSGARMPDCLGVRSRKEREGARTALTHYLASCGGPLARGPLLVDAQTVERGRQLYHSVGCVACHAPFEKAATLASPLWDFEEAFEPSPASPAPESEGPRDPLALRGLAERTTLDALARYLADPLATHPAGRMPSLGLDACEARDVAAYLLYEDEVARGGVRLVYGRGLQLEVFEGSFPDDTVDFDALAPVRSETATSFFEGIAHREDDYGFRFRGFLSVPQAGEYWFYTRSDDGSMLYVDGALVVDNRGQHSLSERHGKIRLKPGRHAFEVTYFEHLGGDGLEVSWNGPATSKEAIPFDYLSHLVVGLPKRPDPPAFALDPRLVERGRRQYAELGCASCHAGGDARAAPLVELDPRRGCLAREPEGDAPRYRFAPGEREDLVAAVRAKAPPEPAASKRLEHELARLNCGACHERGALTGPSDERRPYFQVASGLDLGDQGRFPPSLERAGAKLKPAWFRAVLESRGSARPYMKTRMPQFGAANVAALPELFAAADARLRDEREPEFTPEAVEAGKQLTGTKGLGCIQCHDFAGHPSIGIPAVDLAKVHERVYPGWFRELLMDPVAIGMNTRMPAFWVDGRSPAKHVLDGDPARQVDALWTYLSLGSSMPLPQGLVPIEGEYEVEVLDAPVCVGVFMDGVSPRTVAVGLPERVHYAFDVQNSRLALAWRGRFFDARGTWHGRAGQLEKPAGEDVLEFPSGPALAVLAKPDDPWPASSEGWRALGRRYLPAWIDEPELVDGAADVPARRRPTFDYERDGLGVAETSAPELRPGGAALVRRLHLSRDADGGEPSPTGVTFRAAIGDVIGRDTDGAWVVEMRRPLRVRTSSSAYVVLHDGRAELRVPVEFRDGHVTDCRPPSYVFGQYPVHEADLEVEYSW